MAWIYPFQLYECCSNSVTKKISVKNIWLASAFPFFSLQVYTSTQSYCLTLGPSQLHCDQQTDDNDGGSGGQSRYKAHPSSISIAAADWKAYLTTRCCKLNKILQAEVDKWHDEHKHVNTVI